MEDQISDRLLIENALNALPDEFKYILLYNPYYYLITYFRNSFYIDANVDYYFNIIIFIFVLSSFLLTAYVFYRGFKVIK